MDEVTPPADPGEEPQPADATARRSGGWALAGLAVMVAFVASVVLSTESSSVPVGASDSMPGMSMGDGRLAVTVRDLDDRTVRLPGGRSGVVVFAEARGCDSCIAAARAARDAVRSTGARAQLIVLMVDAATARGDVAAFARSVGRSPARYVIDDRTGGLSSMVGATGLGGTVVYDADGQIVAHPGPGAYQLAAALRKARG